jgi:hypothetical protein
MKDENSTSNKLFKDQKRVIKMSVLTQQKINMLNGSPTIPAGGNMQKSTRGQSFKPIKSR